MSAAVDLQLRASRGSGRRGDSAAAGAGVAPCFVLAHSAGVYNAVEGITKFAKDCCCEKGGVTINLLLIAPKIAARIIRRKLMEAMEDCPDLEINIRLYYDSRDSDIPRHGWPFWQGEWEEGILVTPEERRTGTGPFASFSEEEIAQDPTEGTHAVHGFTSALGIHKQVRGRGSRKERDERRRTVLRFLNQK